MKKTTTAALVLALTPITLGLATAAPSAAACSAKDLTRTDGVLQYGEGTRAYLFAQVSRKTDCSQVMHYGYIPADKVALGCSGVRAIIVNPSPVRGYDAKSYRMPCKSWGYQVWRSYWPKGSDRCVYLQADVDKIFRDRHLTTKSACGA